MIILNILFSSHLSKLVQAGHSVFHENMSHQPSGLVKEMIRHFGPDFRTLLDMEGVHSVKYLVNMRKLEIIASESAYKEVLRNDFTGSVSTLCSG